MPQVLPRLSGSLDTLARSVVDKGVEARTEDQPSVMGEPSDRLDALVRLAIWPEYPSTVSAASREIWRDSELTARSEELARHPAQFQAESHVSQ